MSHINMSDLNSFAYEGDGSLEINSALKETIGESALKDL